MLDNKPNQPTKFRAKNWIEINDESRGTYTVTSSLCDYSNVYILVKGTITVATKTAAAPNNANKVIFNNCAPFFKCISRINNTQVDYAHYRDVEMAMYNLIETSGILSQCWRDEKVLADDSTTADFNADNADTNSFNIRQKNKRSNIWQWHKKC